MNIYIFNNGTCNAYEDYDKEYFTRHMFFDYSFSPAYNQITLSDTSYTIFDDATYSVRFEGNTMTWIYGIYKYKFKKL